MRAVLLVALSLVLLVCDQRWHCFAPLRSKVFAIIAPIQSVINWPIAAMNSNVAGLVSTQRILAEHAHLSSELQLLKVKLQRLDFLEQENSQLRVLLKLANELKFQAAVAKLLRSSLDNFNQQFTIDKGKQQAVYVGQTVLDADGLLGQVVLVENNFSKILLITDSNSAVPVMVIRNGIQVIASGVGKKDYLELVNVSATMDIKVGDVLVTSELGKRFPAGYQVGVVKEIKQVVGERFMKVVVVPKAHIDGSLYVLLIWPDLTEKSGPSQKIK